MRSIRARQRMAGPKPSNVGCGPATLTLVFRNERSALRQRPRREESIVAAASYPVPDFLPEAVIFLRFSYCRRLKDDQAIQPECLGRNISALGKSAFPGVWIFQPAQLLFRPELIWLA